MESDLQQHHHIFQQQHNQQQMNSGLTRYRSAPSSYFQEQIDRELCAQFFKRPSSPETERIFAEFMSSGGGKEENSILENQDLPTFPENSYEAIKTENDDFLSQINQETETLQQQQQQQQKQSNYPSSPSSNIYQNPVPDPGKFRGISSSGMNQLPPMRTGGSNCNLIRHSSSPAGLFADIDIEIATGFAGMSSYSSSSSRIKSETTNFSSGKPPPPLPPSSSSGLMSTISETESKAMKMTSEFPVGNWENPSSIMPENLASPKRTRTGDGNTFSSLNAPEDQSVDSGIRRHPSLAHHLSLPKNLQDITAIFPDSVPCKIRAKRGCATHPRSIAERVRRTRISERMRKLQELVPNMDKQTNTAEMLDLAVEYIRELQRQVKVLEEKRVKCTCANKQHQ